MSHITEDLSGKDLKDYRLTEIIGGGGMATVYLGTKKDTTLPRKNSTPRTFAIKVLKRSLIAADATYTERFMQEMENILSLRNAPNTIRIQDYGLDGDYYYIVMEHYTGGTLAEYTSQQGGRLSIEEVITILKDIAPAIDAAHKHDIIHRDIKPSNILFDSNRTAILADFGISRAKEAPHLTQMYSVIGTRAYLAPEVFEGQEADIKSDLYSLGVLTYDLLSGIPPERDTSGKISSWHKSTKPLLETVSVPVARVVNRMIHPQPMVRYNSAMEFVAALEVALSVDESDDSTSSNARYDDGQETLVMDEQQSTYTGETPNPSKPFRREPWQNQWERKRLPCWIVFSLLTILGVGSLILVLMVDAGDEDDNPTRTEVAMRDTTEPLATEGASLTASTLTPTQLITPSKTPTETKTPTPTDMPSKTPTVRPTDSPSATWTPSATITFTSNPTQPEVTPTLLVTMTLVPLESGITPLITNAQYEVCENAGKCPYPSSSTARYTSPQFDNDPVVGITWFNAQAFCRENGGRLPLLEEWLTSSQEMRDKDHREWLALDTNNVLARIEGMVDTTPVRVINIDGVSALWEANDHFNDVSFRCVKDS